MPSRLIGSQGAATVAIAIVVAAAIIGYSLPGAPRGPTYQAFVVEGKIVRLNTRNGNLIACDFERCVRVLGSGKKLARNSEPGLLASKMEMPPEIAPVSTTEPPPPNFSAATAN